MRATIVGTVAIGVYLALSVRCAVVLIALYHNAPRAAILLHEWPLTAVVVAFGIPAGIAAAGTLAPWLRFLIGGLSLVAGAAAIVGLTASLVSSPVTAPVAQFDLLAGAIGVTAGILIIVAVALDPTSTAR